MKLSDDDKNDRFGNRVYQNLMDMWIAPSIKTRQDKGDLQSPLEIYAAQIIFSPDEENPIVNVNDEIKVIAKVKIKNNIDIKKGDPISREEIEKYNDLKINEEIYPNCGHATFIIHNGTILLVFDFTRYKLLSKQHLEVANQFLECAKFSYEKQFSASLIDNLFSAKELIAKSLLLKTAEKEFAQKTNHNAIHCRYNKSSQLGNVDSEHVDVFNTLSRLRSQVRYLNGELIVTQPEGKKLLDMVDKAYHFALKNNQDSF